MEPLCGIGRALTYGLGGYAGQVGLGSLVRIPLGRRVELGVVSGFGEAEELGWAGEVKPLAGVVQGYPVVREEGLRLARWMAGYYSCGMEQVMEVMIPAAVRRGMSPKRERVLRCGREPEEGELVKLAKRAPQQARVWRMVREQAALTAIPRGLVMKRLGVSGAVVDGLVKKGLLEEREASAERVAYADELSGAELAEGAGEVALTAEQEVAAGELVERAKAGQFAVHLLHGVTGSGKTEVYLRVMERVLGEGGGVLFLVPEVALTPQTVGRLRARFEGRGHKVVVWHSHLSDGQRADAWRAVATGEARIVVGARSAVFAPVLDLRLVVVDEEHEPAYKQEEVPRYHGRDVAVYRAMLNDALCIAGSATPSLESLHNVATGKYKINRLSKRVDNRQLPLMHVVDMRREKGGRVFSQFLAEKMRGRLERGEQMILFLNRRGHDASLHCPDCGYVAVCDHCDITLTHHIREKRLRCHLCGDEAGVPTICPKCRSPKIHYRGSGTQKVELQAQRILPGARVVRIDADTMRRRHAFREHLQAFRQGRIDVLVGTQMIGKGLDFPNVTLVGLLDADLSLHLPDFRAAERSFQLLVQVSGRAGRGDRSGEVVVQSTMPSSPTIQYARQQDFDGFTQDELAHRREFGYPPYRHLLHHLFRGRSEEKVRFYAEQWMKSVREELEKMGVEAKGPVPCPVERIQDQFRYQIWYFCGKVTPVVGFLSERRRSFRWDKEVVEILDVDAMNLM